MIVRGRGEIGITLEWHSGIRGSSPLGSIMTRLLLAAGVSSFVIEKDGEILIRDKKGDRSIPYSQEHADIFLESAVSKYGMLRVIGLDGEFGPELVEGEWPRFVIVNIPNLGKFFRYEP